MVSINKKSCLLLIFLLFFEVVSAQNRKYIVYFKDKNNSPYSISTPSLYLSDKAIERRTRQKIAIVTNDLPVAPDYIDSLLVKGAEVQYSLKWLNAAVVIADSLQMVDINTLTFVKSYDRVARKMTTKEISNICTITKQINKKSALDYGGSFDQIHMLQADNMHAEGFHGEGVLIALLDAGFKNASSLGCLSHVYSNNRVVATYDFVDNELDVYDDHEHGEEVLTTIAAFQSGTLIGTAYNASFVLLRTEDDFSETEVEETNWARGAEYADSIGADILSSSLGYTTFDAPGSSHTYMDMNGNTTIAAQAADLAASKGILVICSAGNDGNNSWRYIDTPADGDSVLAIGAVDANMNRATFSSVGPSADGRIKPDLAAMGQNVLVGTPLGGFTNSSGTSFSCPLTAGFVAGIWQAFPTLTNMQLTDALRKSASQYSSPDNFLGYGIPGFTKAKEFILDSIFNIGIDFRIFPNPIKSGYLFFTSGAEYFNKPVTIKMYDMLGRQVAEDQLLVAGVKTETNIFADAFKDGVYILRFYFPDKTVKIRLVKY